MRDEKDGRETLRRANEIAQWLLKQMESKRQTGHSPFVDDVGLYLFTGADLVQKQDHAGNADDTDKAAPHEPAPRGAAPDWQVHVSGAYARPYTEEAIPPRQGGTSWYSPHKPRKEQVRLPEVLRRLRKLEKSGDADGATLTGSRLFLAQARLASDYTDDYPVKRPASYRYVSSYQALSNAELRSYFAWRTIWRGGGEVAPYEGFIRILAGELVNGIGAGSATECYEKLKSLEELADSSEVWETRMRLAYDLNHWICDYVIISGLDPSLARTDGDAALGSAVATMRGAERAVLLQEGIDVPLHGNVSGQAPTNEELWQALGVVSSYRLERSPFFRAHPGAAADAASQVFRKLAIHCARRRKTRFVDGLVGWEGTSGWWPFPGLMYAEQETHPDARVVLNPSEIYTCQNGRWRVYHGYERSSPNRELGQILRALDRQMRLDFEFGRPLKERPLPKYLNKMIVSASAQALQNEKEAERRKVEIDFSKLGHIRSAAALTRDALLVEEEMLDVPDVPAAGNAAAAEPPAEAGAGQEAAKAAVHATSGAPDADADASSLLTGQELALLKSAFTGAGDGGTTPTDALSLSLLVDSINEKLFDEIGDSVLEIENGAVYAVEDYADDVRELLGI